MNALTPWLALPLARKAALTARRAQSCRLTTPFRPSVAATPTTQARQ